MKQFIFVFLLFSLANTTSILAQHSKLGNWISYTGNMKLGTKWNVHHEIQHRNYNFLGDLEQLLLRTGIGYILAGRNNFLLGYAFLHNQRYIDHAEDKLPVNEQRIFQQFVTQQKIYRIKVKHRYRLEQRWIDDSDFRLRFRYALALKIPMNHYKLMDKT